MRTRSQAAAEESLSLLPQDALELVAARLSTRQLALFACVSKACCAAAQAAAQAKVAAAWGVAFAPAAETSWVWALVTKEAQEAASGRVLGLGCGVQIWAARSSGCFVEGPVARVGGQAVTVDGRLLEGRAIKLVAAS